MSVERDEEEIEDQISKALDIEVSGENPYWGATYGEGVRNALEWVIGYTSEPPFDN